MSIIDVADKIPPRLMVARTRARFPNFRRTLRSKALKLARTRRDDFAKLQKIAA